MYIIGGKPKDFTVKAKDRLPTIKICEECCCECGRYINDLKKDEKVEKFIKEFTGDKQQLMMYYMYYKDSHYCEITGNKIKVYPQRDNEGKYIKTKDPKQALLTKYTK